MIGPSEINALRQAMRDIARKKGQFTVFALLRRPEARGGWDLVVSAPWLESGKLKAVRELVSLLSETIGDEPIKDFSRIATVRRNDEFVTFLLNNLPVEDGELHVSSSDLQQLNVEDAIIFRAKDLESRPAPSRTT